MLLAQEPHFEKQSYKEKIQSILLGGLVNHKQFQSGPETDSLKECYNKQNLYFHNVNNTQCAIKK